MGSYVPNTDKDRQVMLDSIGAKSIEELYNVIPEEIKLTSELNIPKGLSELEVKNKMAKIGSKNHVFRSIFRGCGAYNHYIPSVVKHISSKEEFVTAYTPYQAEISQGVLQSIFEYQTLICELTGMDVANASVYDGMTAAAEAVLMCLDRKKRKILISETVNPQIIETIKTYCIGIDCEIVIIPSKDGKTDIEALEGLMDKQVSSVLVQQPNYYGQIEDCSKIGEIAKQYKGYYIISANPISLGLYKTPREYGADVAIGEGQPLGLGLSFGGPYLGFMATTSKNVRKLPGRIAGETTDDKGNRAFVLTLQAREQHIRREKASSNICSNQALCAMTASVYLSSMGEKGLEKVASLSMSKAHYLASRLSELPDFELLYEGEFFNEFVTRSPGKAYERMKALEKFGILGGYPINDRDIIWCATEMNSKEDIDELIDVLKEVSV